MRKAHTTITPPETWHMIAAVARLYDVPVRLLAMLPFHGRPRSAHRHRNRGRAS